MKKIISIVLAVSLLLLSACNVKVAETNDETKSQASASNAETADNAESQTSSVGADNEIIDYDGTLFGVIVKPIENFKVLPLPETVPYVYEENGLFGYKNPDGSVLIPAEYNVAQDFYMGFGSVRKDTTVNGEPNYEWFEVTSKGKIFDVDSYTYMEGIGLWVAVKDGKHGVINAEGEEIIPLEYDFHALAYDESFYTGFKDGSAFSFDLKKAARIPMSHIMKPKKMNTPR